MEKDMRIPKMQEKLEGIMAKVQSITIQASAGNVTAIYDIISNLQIVYNTLAIMHKEQVEGEENGRKTDTE